MMVAKINAALSRSCRCGRARASTGDHGWNGIDFGGHNPPRQHLGFRRVSVGSPQVSAGGQNRVFVTRFVHERGLHWSARRYGSAIRSAMNECALFRGASPDCSTEEPLVNPRAPNQARHDDPHRGLELVRRSCS